MNLFYLDKNPKICAQMHNNKHVVKMILETAQLLSTAHRILEGAEFIEVSPNNRRIKRWKLNDHRDASLYKATHINHPSAVWVRKSIDNYQFAFDLFVELCKEYTYRYGKTHKAEQITHLLKNPPKNIAKIGFSEPPQCMPDYCKDICTVQAYRNYYLNEKSEMLVYKNRDKPYWMPR